MPATTCANVPVDYFRVTLRAPDFKVGGEGMRAFYDKIVPATLNKLLAKLGGANLQTLDLLGRDKIGPGEDDGAGGAVWRTQPGKVELHQPGFAITDTLREKAGGPLPLFSQKAQPGALETFAQAVDAAMTSLKSYVAPIPLGKTPEVLVRLGAPDVNLTINRDVIRKATNGVKHNVTMEAIKALPEQLANPVMVFDSKTLPGNLVVLTEFNDGRGAPVVAAVHLSKIAGRGMVVNEITSVHGREPATQISGWVRDGLMRYRHQEKSLEWFRVRGLQLPKSGNQGGMESVLTDADFVNPDHPDQTGKFSQSETPSTDQTETAAFQQWFGDWALAASGVDREAKTFDEARAAAKAFQGKPLKNKASGKVAVLSRNGLDKMLNAKAVSKSESAGSHAFAVANLDQLFERAILGWSKPDAQGNPNIAAIQRFFAPVVKNGNVQLVKLTVKETVDPAHANPIYTVEAVEFDEKSPAAQWVDATMRSDGIDPTSIRSAREVVSLAQRVQDFNVGAVSKVVDADGKPLVVYHGTANTNYNAIPDDGIKEFRTPAWFAPNVLRQ